jgi:hypothetical protein
LRTADRLYDLHNTDRYEAFNYWAIDQAPHDNSNPIILKGGYLTRTAKVTGNTLALTGDLNATTAIDILGGATNITTLTFNNQTIPITATPSGVLTATIPFTRPAISIPQLSTLSWKYLDALPEIQPNYDDSAWPKADLAKTYNSLRPLNTPTSLYASDYGFHTGSLIYRGTFTATGTEKTLSILTQGGSAFGASAWLDSTFLSSFRGFDAALNGTISASLATLTPGQKYTITVVIDHMGLDENWTIGTESMKNPRGILNYTLDGHAQSDIAWKLTGNLGGEDYKDVTRGPLNEGAFYPERMGFHLPGAFTSPSVPFKPTSGPVLSGLPTSPGIAFFATEFPLNIPAGYDVPLSFVIANTTTSTNSTMTTTPAYRLQLFVNGWQYGKFVSNVGPQTRFPVPEGILNYRGTNYVALTLWGLDDGGDGGVTRLGGFDLVVDGVMARGYKEVGVVEGVGFERREGAY